MSWEALSLVDLAVKTVQVSSGLALRLFQYEELELLICGLPHLDFAGLRAAAHYEGGYHPDHPVIIQFWEVVMSLTLEQKKSFLRFCTGCDRYKWVLQNIFFLRNRLLPLLCLLI